MPNEIPPAYKFPCSSGAAVNPQLSVVEPVKVENVNEGSMIKVSLLKLFAFKRNEQVLFFNSKSHATGIFLPFLITQATGFDSVK